MQRRGSAAKAATFLSTSLESRWSATVKSTGGKTVAVLSLELDFDTRNHIVTLEGVLRRSSDNNPDASNLLDPTGRRHGLQAYDFAAGDCV
jgi:hypothetical protein